MKPIKTLMLCALFVNTAVVSVSSADESDSCSDQYEHDGAFVTYQPRTSQGVQITYSNNEVINGEYEHDGAFVSYHSNNGPNTNSLTSIALNQTIKVADLVRFIAALPEISNLSLTNEQNTD